MVTVNLTPGVHSIELELAGYAIFKGVINVATGGTVYCMSVVDGSCGAYGMPGMSISVNVVTAILKEISSDLCGWISGLGGWAELSAYDIMTTINGYVGQEDLGFNVLSAHIMGVIAYYSGNKINGDQLTGCSF